MGYSYSFKSIFSEVPQNGSERRTPEKLWVDKGSEFYHKISKTYLFKFK